LIFGSLLVNSLNLGVPRKCARVERPNRLKH
jgi:hypothetical protein